MFQRVSDCQHFTRSIQAISGFFVRFYQFHYTLVKANIRKGLQLIAKPITQRTIKAKDKGQQPIVIVVAPIEVFQDALKLPDFFF
jgi:hypothetical protein